MSLLQQKLSQETRNKSEFFSQLLKNQDELSGLKKKIQSSNITFKEQLA
jgi:hypothetical protein